MPTLLAPPMTPPPAAPPPDPLAVLQTVYLAHLPDWAAGLRARMGTDLRREADPDDLLQEVWVRMDHRQHEFAAWVEDEAADPADWERMALHWLNRLVADVTADHLKHQHAQKRTVDRRVGIPDPSSAQFALGLIAALTSPSRELARQDEAAWLRTMIDQLKAEDREILALRVLDRLSTDETAARLGLEPATVRKRYVRAILRLKLLCDAEGG